MYVQKYVSLKAMKSIAPIGFDWDEGNWPKCGKLGLTKAEIEAVFVNEPAIYEHPDHSDQEQRLRAIGQNDDGRYIYISFTIRTKNGADLIRPVTARYMHRKEIDQYEQR